MSSHLYEGVLRSFSPITVLLLIFFAQVVHYLVVFWQGKGDFRSSTQSAEPSFKLCFNRLGDIEYADCRGHR